MKESDENFVKEYLQGFWNNFSEEISEGNTFRNKIILKKSENSLVTVSCKEIHGGIAGEDFLNKSIDKFRSKAKRSKDRRLKD